MKLTGAVGLDGEAGYTAPERIGGRPTLDINGIWGWIPRGGHENSFTR
ncbi:MAG: hypothetical protein CM15mP98_11060 [Paracoccaceae bacterium]|nr:MAG: hypothetical protein CM15mP98_11060 [Paracoccaceae bacterium]